MTHPLHRIILVSILLLQGACSGKIRINTATFERDIRDAYENCLRDEGGAFEFTSQKEFIARLEGKNLLGIRYLGVPSYMRDQDGEVIDEWGRPLRITRPEKNKLEIRSASEDGIFGTADDIITDYPPVPGSRK